MAVAAAPTSRPSTTSTNAPLRASRTADASPVNPGPDYDNIVYHNIVLASVFPTVEVRAADTAAGIDDALLQAVLTRALVRTAIAQVNAGIEAPRFDNQLGAAAVWTAARYGLNGPAIDPVGESRVPAACRLRAMVDWIADELDEVGDLELANRLLGILGTHGVGAERQLRAARFGGRDLVNEFRLRPRSGGTG